MHWITQYCVHIWIPDRIYITLTLQGIRQINNTRIIHRSETYRDDDYHLMLLTAKMREKLIHRYTCVVILLIALDIMYIMHTYLTIIS